MFRYNIFCCIFNEIRSLRSVTDDAGWLTVGAERLDGRCWVLDSRRFKDKSALHLFAVGSKTKFKAESAPYLVSSGQIADFNCTFDFHFINTGPGAKFKCTFDLQFAMNRSRLCDYHAGAYEHALWHIRLTARSHPTAISKKPIPFQESDSFFLWRRGWDSNPRGLAP